MEEKYKVIHCKYTNKEVVAVWDHRENGWFHLHNETEEQDLQDVEYFNLTGYLLKRNFNGEIIE